MEKLRLIQSTAVPLRNENVDTDQIIPSEWLKRVSRTGFEEGLFSSWRARPDFVLNSPKFSGARILLAGDNFGIGSSREHAVWALSQYGFLAVISTKFGDIFQNNAHKNGMLTATVSPETLIEMFETTESSPATEWSISIEDLAISSPSAQLSASFELSLDAQTRLLTGLDDISATMEKLREIEDFESRRPSWLQ